MEFTGNLHEDFVMVAVYVEGLPPTGLVHQSSSARADVLELLTIAYRQTDALCCIFTLGPEMAEQSWANALEGRPRHETSWSADGLPPASAEFYEAMRFVLQLTPAKVMSMCSGLSRVLDRAEIAEHLERMRDRFDVEGDETGSR